MKRLSSLVIAAVLLSACGGSDDTTSKPDSPQLETAQPDIPDAPAPKTAPSETSSTNPYETSIILTDPDGVTQITWEDLMPVGEEAVLAQLYEQYYDDLRKSMEAQSELLKEADIARTNGDDFDISL